MTPHVFSGIQPTGELTLGTYLGALRRFVANQDSTQSVFCVVDLHALTVPQEPALLRERTLDTAALYLACGIDPAASTLFVQSHVAEHSQLAWLMECTASFGELSRMTQFKEKSEQQQFVSAGLFTYPALMAADILLYDTDRVPVGDDQRQHLELTRDAAERFNSRYGDTLTVPEPYVQSSAQRIKDLQNPAAKMSTSRGGPGTLWVIDDPKAITKKIKSAVTDTGRDVVAAPDKPGITNLLTILSVASGTPVPELESAYVGKGYGDLKGDVAAAVVALFAPVRERYADLIADTPFLDGVLADGAGRARAVARETLAAVRERIGLLPSA